MSRQRDDEPAPRHPRESRSDDVRATGDEEQRGTQPMPLAVVLMFVLPLVLLIVYGILTAH